MNLIIEALKDTLEAIPFLIAAFFLIDVVQHRLGDSAKHKLYNLGKWGPLYGAILGSLPQCGFSVIASSLFIEGIITPGSLIAVYIATSDEALPILMSHPSSAATIFPLVGFKVLFGVCCGFLTDLLWKRKKVEVSEPENIACQDYGQECIGDERKSYREILVHAVHHTLEVSLYIFAATLILNVVFVFNQNDFVALFKNNVALQPIVTGIFGLIPNCATSVIITQAYILHIITFGALFAGLSSNAGFGLLVLLKESHYKRDAFFIVTLLLLFSISVGILLNYGLK